MGKFELDIVSDHKSDISDVVLELQSLSEKHLGGRISRLQEYSGAGYDIRGKYDTGLKLSTNLVEKEAISLFRKIYESVPKIHMVQIIKDHDNFISSSSHDGKVEFHQKLGEYFDRMFLSTLYEPIDGASQNLYNRIRKVSLDGLSFYEMDYEGNKKIQEEVEITPSFEEIKAE